MSTEIKLLSAGAVQPGLVKVTDIFRRKTGHEVSINYATAAAIRKRIDDGEKIDVVIAPPDLLDELVQAGKANPDSITVGRIGVGVMVRDGAAVPKIATVEEFRQSLLNAESIVYNQASTGVYLEGLFDRLGIDDHLKAKTTRYPDFAAVLDHVRKGHGVEIGFGATTVIIESASKVVKFVGPLPADIQNYTTYAAMALTDGAVANAAHALVHFMTNHAAKNLFKAAGID